MANSVDQGILSASATGSDALPEQAAPLSEAQLLAQATEPAAKADPVPVDAGSGQPIQAAQPNAAPPAPATSAEYTADASNVVHLPANISVDNIKVDGKNLILEQADGTEIVVKDAASNVPTFMLGDVELPRVALIAALEAGGVDVAFGPDGSISVGPGSTNSSGGNFETPVGGIGNGFDLSALLPPTALQFPQYENRELYPGLRRNRGPEIEIDTGNPGGDADFVQESGLAGIGSNPNAPTEFAGGTFKLSDPDGLSEIQSVTINGKTIAISALQGSVIDGAHGVLTITSYNPTTGVATYTYELTSPTTDIDGVTETDNFTLTVSDGTDTSAPADIVIEIVDDVPVLVADTDSIAAGSYVAATGNVLTDAEGDGGADTLGADGGAVVGVAAGATGATLEAAATVGAVVNGTYGQLTLNGDGSYSYVRNPGSAGGVSDVFTYTVKDGDGDLVQTTLTIDIGNSTPEIGGLTPEANGGDVIVDEDDLLASRGSGESEGSDTIKESTTQGGDFTITSPDGVKTLVIEGVTVIANGALTGTLTVTTTLGNTLTVTGYNPGTGVVNYTYTLADNETHTTGSGENSLFENLSLTLTDQDDDVATGTLSVNIVDDVPVLVADTDSIAAGSYVAATGNVLTDAEGDGGADTLGADGGAVVGVAAGATGATLEAAATVGAVVNGTYGQLTLNGDGSYSYVRNPGSAGGVSDVFTYTVKDGDGDLVQTTLTIDIGNSTPEIGGLTPEANGGDVIVDEDDLLASRGSGESEGSDTIKESTTQGGDFTITSPDGVKTLVIEGVTVIANGALTGTLTVTTTLGNTLTVTGYNPGTGVVNYTYTLADNETHTAGSGENSLFENLSLTLTDQDDDVATGTLSVNIVDDVPVLVADTDSIAAGSYVAATGNVLTDAEGDGGADTLGADGGAVVGVAAGATGATLEAAATVGAVVNGTYGQLTLNGDGSYSYVRNPGSAGGVSDVFTYTVKDGDGDLVQTTLTIDIGNSTPEIGGLTPEANGGDVIVDEDDLLASRGSGESEGSDTIKESTTQGGDFTITSPDGVKTLVIEGVTVIANGALTGTLTVTTTLGNTLTVTGYNPGTGVVNYTYTLADNETHTAGSGENSLFENLSLTLTDQDDDVATGTLSVNIVDDVPVLVADTDSIAAGSYVAATGNVLTDAEGDGGADTLGADGGAVVGVAAGATGATLEAAATVGAVVNGTYGQLTLNGDGSYSYVRNPGSAGGVSDVFTYTVKDGDGDLVQTTLTIDIGNSTPEIGGLTPEANGGDVIVDEDDLLASRGSGESEGSDTIKESTTQGGDFTITSPDGVKTLVIEGVTVIANGALTGTLTVTTTLGNTLTVTGYNPGTGVVNYTYTLADNETHTAGSGENSLFENLSLTLTDQDDDVATGTLSVNIVDDVPVLVADTDSIAAGSYVAATGNVLTDAEGDGGADTLGADGGAVVGVAAGATGATLEAAATVGAVVNGTYGQLTLNGDGSYSYVRNPGSAGGVSDVFTYTVKDGDGDLVQTTLTIDIGNSTPEIGGLTPEANGGDVIVDEDDLLASRGSGESEGSDTIKESTTQGGDFTITSPDGVKTLVIEGVTVIANGALTGTLTVTTTLGNTLTVTGYNPGTGVVNYTYTLADNETHTAGSGENSLFENLSLTLTDQDDDVATGTLSVNIVDDVPVLVADTDSIAAGSYVAATGNVLTDAEGDGGADTLGADGGAVVGVAAGATGATLEAAATVGAVVNGTYGQLTLNGDGSYSYVRNPGSAGGVSDVFTYTVKDGDGDLVQTTLTIDIGNSTPEIGGLTPEANGGDVIVDEDDLLASRGSGESEGSDTIKESTTQGGDFTITSPDGVKTLVIEGVTVIANGALTGTLTVTTTLGNTLTVTGYNPGTGVVNYTYTLADNETHTAGSGENSLFENLSLTLTDQDDDVATGTLSVNIVDDVPVLVADTDSIAAGSYVAATGNVLTDAEGDGGADTLGADGGAVVGVAAGATGATLEAAATVGAVVNGTYGQLTLNGDGSYSYVRNPGSAGGVSDVFTYTVKDGDGDLVQTTLTIDIGNSTPEIGGLTPEANGGDVIVDEDDLLASRGSGESEGSDTIKESTTQGGDFTITSPDGVKTLVIEGVTVIANGALTGTLTVTTTLGNTLTVTGYNPGTGVVNYTYTLADNETHTAGSGENSLFENLSLTLTDQDDDVATGTLSVNIVDDVPVLVADTDSIAAGSYVAATGNVLTDAEGDGGADTLGADGGAVVGVAAGATGATLEAAATVGAVVNGTYGQLTLNGDGSYSYVRNPGSAGGVSDVFTYTVKDGDGDLVQTTLTIDIGNSTPEIGGLTPEANGGDVIVDEDDLLASRGSGESEGSDTIKESTTQGGDFTITSPDGVKTLVIEGVTVIANGALTGTLTVTTTLGNTLTVTGYNPGTGVVNYTYTLADNETHTAGSGENSLFENLSLTLTDQDDDVATGTLSVNIVDDVPVLVADTDSIAAGSYVAATGNVLTDAEGDGGADTLGADGGAVVGVAAGATGATLEAAATVGAVVNGTYGQLTLNGDGSYSYVRNPGSAGGVSDVFTYTVKDGDGDLVQTTLTIDIGNSTPEIGGLTPEANGGDVIVDEDDLLASRGSGESEGSDTIKESTTQGGDFTITSPDGVKTLVIEGVTVIANGALTGTLTVTTTLGNTLTVTGYNPGTGVVNYTYTLADNETHTAGSGENSLFENLSLTLTDQDDDVATGTLSVNIVDDVPVLVADTDSIAAGSYVAATGNVLTDAEGDGGADTLGADGGAVVGVAAGATGATLEAAATVGAVVNGTYGQLTLNGDGSYSYVRNPGSAGGVSDVFTYTVKDGDGDLVQTTLTIDIGNSTPEIGGLTPEANGGDVIVDEDDLLASRGSGESEGSDTIKESTTQGGDFTITSPDGVKTLVIEGVTVIANGALTGTLTVTTTLGNTLTVTGYNPGTGVVNYTYTLADNETHTAGSGENSLFENLSLTLTDQDDDVATGTLSVNIVDDVPVLVADTDSIAAGSYVAATGNVLTDAEGDGGADTLGADGGAVVGVAAGATGATLEAAATVGAVVNGTYGQLTLNGDGSYSYVRNPGSAGGVSDVFTYTVKDGDGDLVQTTLTIDIGNSTPEIGGLTPEANGGDVIVDEDDLLASRGSGESEGSDTIKESTTQGGDFTITSPDGVKTLVIEGVTVIANGALTGTLTVTTTLGNTLTVTGYNPGTGVVNYTYTLADNETHTAGSGENSLFENLSLTLTDQDDDVATGTLSVNIVDDVPVLVADTDSIAAGSYVAATGNVLTDAEGDGGADTLGADGGAVVGVAAGATGATLEAAATVGAVVNGTYGQLTLNGDGSYSYVRNPGSAGGVSDVFTYTVKDGDGDLVQTTLTIDIGNSTPEIGGLTPEANGGDVIVDEDDLLASRGSGESEGSDTIKESTTQGGDFTITSPDGVKTLVIEGVTVIANGALTGTLTVTTTLGNTLTVTGYNPGTGVVNYTYTLADNETHTTGSGENSLFENLSLTLTDQDDDVATGTLSVNIVDDVPVLVADTDSIAAGSYVAATGNVLTDAEGDGGADTLGADGGAVVGVAAGATGATLEAAATVGAVVNGTYGQLTLNGDGSYSYVRNPGSAGGVSDVFTYTVKDGDGDLVQTTLTIDIGNSTPEIGGLTPEANGGDVIVDEDDLLASRGSGESEGSDTIKESTTQGGDFTITSPDGVKTLVIEGVTVIANGALTGTLTVTTTLGNTLTVTGYNPGTGVVNYTYTLADNETHTAGSGENSLFENLSLTLTDQDDDVATGTLSVNIVDDVPSVTVTGAGTNSVSAFSVNLDETVQPDGANSPTHDRYRAGGETESTPSAQNGGADDVPNTATPAVDYIRVPTVSSTIDPAKAIGKLTTNVSGGLASLFGVNPVYGADGPAASGSLTQSLTLSLVGATILQTNLTATALAGTALSGLTSAQRQIYLQMEGGMIVGRVPGSSGIGADDAVAFRISVTNASNPAAAQLVVEQFLAIDHGGTENPSIYDEVMSLLTTGANKVQLTLSATITDGDGDSSSHSASVDLVSSSSSAISFDDDGPVAGVDATANTHSIGNAGATVNGDIVVDYGTDGRGTASITVASNPATLTYGGTTLIYDNSNPNVLVAHTGNAADPVFTLTLNPATGGYTFQSFKPLDGVINADVTIGGAFGAGPTSYQVLTSGAGGTGSHLGVVSAWTTGAGFNVANWKTGSTTGITVGQVNGGTNGWGVGNQNFDANEILRFDFGQQVDFDGAGAYVPPGTGIFNGPNVSEASFNFANAGSNDTIHYVMHYTDGTTASGQFDVGTLTGANFEPTAPAGKYFDYIEFYAQDGSSKLDLQSVTTISTTIDIDLDFNVTVRDGDGDALSFPIHVDIVNGAPSAGAVTALIDEDSLANGVAGGLGDTAGTATASGTLAFSFGPDGPAATDPVNFSPMHNLAVVDTGNTVVKSGGVALSYFWDSTADTLYASTNVSSAANALATAAFKVTLNTSDGSYQYTQIKPLDHPGHDDPSSPATELSYEDTIALALRYQVKDANGDSAQGTLTVSVNDDTPTAGPDSATLDIVVDDLGVGAIVATWTNVQMTSGSPVTFDRDGDGSTDEIRWPTGSGSGYGFVDNPALANTPVTTNETFNLGTFTHFNFPVSGGTLTSTTLSVTFTALINGEQVQVGPILVNFTHNETTNTGDPEASRDIITIATSTATVNIEGQNYTLDVRGFIDTNGDIVSTVRTYESQQNSYQLAVRFVSSDSTSVTKTGDVISGSDASGADTPLLVTAITHAATTDNTADGSGNFQVNGDHGTLVINKNGTYTYTLTDDASDIPAGASETFTYTVTDADGDAVTQTLTIALNKVDSSANPLHGDRVLTNISGGSGTDIVISEAALLYNDEAGSTVNGTVTNVNDATSVIYGSGSYTFKDNDTDGGKFTYSGQNGATADNAIVTVDRSQAGNSTLTGTSFSEILIGRDAADTINGGGGDDYIVANAGADTIDGGVGADAILAGAGNDTIIADQADKLIDGGADSDTLNVGANFTSTSDAQIINIENVTLTAAATLNLSNQTEGFIITGSGGDDIITGGSGADSISAGGGNDIIVGSQNDSLLAGGSGTDTLQIGANFTSAGDSQITGIENITLTSVATLNLANQSEGFFITGSAGADSITGGGGNDTIVGAQNDTLLAGGGGTDTLQIGANFTSIGDGQIINVENVTLTAAVSLDLSNQAEGFKIIGSSGSDTIKGGSGADIINAGGGTDALTGNGGADQFRFATNTGSDTVTDYTDGTDRIGFLGGNITGGVNFVTTGSGSSAGTVLSASAFATAASIEDISSSDDNKVIRITSAQTTDQIENDDPGSSSRSNIYVLVFNSDTGKGEIWFDSAWESTGGRTLVATLNNVTSLAQLQNIDYNDIVVYSSAVDPILLDLDKNGYSFSNIDGGIRFDFNADGIADQVAWNTSGDGILAYDVNGDGKIDSGAEIFTPDFAGGKFASGAEALASLDSNGDGIVDADDEAFSKLLIWQDANSDGVGEAGELTHLADHGIAGLGTSTTGSTDIIDGQQVAGEGTVHYADGSTGTYVEVMLDAALGTPEADQPVGETYVIEGLDVADIIPDYDGGKGDQLDLSALLSGLAPDTDLAAQGYVSVVQNGADAEVKVDVDGGGDSFQTVAVLENYTAVNEAVKVLFEDNAGTKHQDNI